VNLSTNLTTIRAATRRLWQDAMYRGSTLLLLNVTVLAGIGFVFWLIAARMYPTQAVGSFSAITGGVGLLAALAALGIPNTLMRHLSTDPAARQLALAAVVAAATAGGTLCLIVMVLFGPHLPGSLDIGSADNRVFVGILAVLAAVGAVIDAGLIAQRATHAIITKSLVGSVARLGAVLILAASGVVTVLGLVLASGIGAGVAVVLGLIALRRSLKPDDAPIPLRRLLGRHLTFSVGNYLATVIGILPATIVPIMVLAIQGPTEAAYFAVASTVPAFLLVIPATTSQVLMAEASRGDETLRAVTRKALRHVYVLLTPAIALGVLVGPQLLRVFGQNYADAGAACLQLLCLSAFASGCTYLIDAILLARDRMMGYFIINAANAALVLVFVGLALPRGITAAAGAWFVAQTLSVVLGVLVLRMTGVWRTPRSRPALPARPG